MMGYFCSSQGTLLDFCTYSLLIFKNPLLYWSIFRGENSPDIECLMLLTFFPSFLIKAN